jgi:rhomboid protease GluP
MTQGIAKESSNLLEVQSTTLMDHSNYYPPLRNSVELWRLVSAIFMHVNLLHFLGNILSTFFLVSRIEYTLGFPKALCIYLLSGISGNIFSDAINKGAFLSAGASTALFGMIGVILGYIILNWNGVDLLGPVIKCQLYCSAMTMFFFVLIFTPSSVNSNIDWYGHLGGFLGGLWLTAIHQTIISNTF